MLAPKDLEPLEKNPNKEKNVHKSQSAIHALVCVVSNGTGIIENQIR